MDKPKQSSIATVLITVIAAIAIIFLVLICLAVSVIVILALMGPAIGNVFSNIVENI